MVKNIPMYQIIEKDLRNQILSGNLKQGDLIPSETELSAKYDVTRMTVRQAINNLLVDGYIYRHKGKGTYVTFNKKEMDKDQARPFFSFEQEMIGINSKVTNKILEFSIREADELISPKLQLNVGDEIYYVERLREADNIPLVYERLYLPKNVYNGLKKEVFNGSFHEYLEKELNFKIRNCESSIEVRALNEKVAKMLGQDIGEPSLYMSSLTYLENGRAILYARQYFHGEHFRFKHNFKK